MKKVLIFLLICLTNILSAQTGYVRVNHSIYSFLERMETNNIISHYNSVELPKSVNDIANYLITIRGNSDQLNQIDSEILNEYLKEFEFAISKFSKSSSLLGNNVWNHMISEKEKYLYKYVTDPEKFSVFVNFIADAKQIYQSDREKSTNYNTVLYNFGGKISGSVLENIAFSIRTTNGSFLGDRSLALSQDNLKYNFKVNMDPSTGMGSDYFDETEGYICADYDNIKLKLGRDRMNIGYGSIKYLVGNYSPPMDYLKLDLRYKAFSFSFFHAKLLGNETTVGDSIQGTLRTIDDKFMAYHRFGIDLSKDFKFGFGEVIIYSNRSMDLSYLNPFNYYKSAEHANQDRDNSILFMDFANNSIDGLKIYSALYLDDIDFGKIGTGWYGNQTLWTIGLKGIPLDSYLPLELDLQYIRIEPYVYTHRIHNNNYTSLDFNIGPKLQPNSGTIFTGISATIHKRVKVGVNFTYTEHGANEVDSNGKVLNNFGGDILVGHRPGDSESISFLDGEREIYRNITFYSEIEPINNYFINWVLSYENNALNNFENDEIMLSKLGISVRF